MGKFLLGVLLGLLFGYSAALGNPSIDFDALSRQLVREMKGREPSWQDAKLSLTFHNKEVVRSELARLSQPAQKEVKWKAVLPKGIRPLGKLSIPLLVSSGGETMGQLYVWTQVRAVRRVVVMGEKVGRNQVLSKGQLAMKEMDVSSLPDAYFTSFAPVVGRETTSRLSPGTVLFSWMVQEKPLFRRGETVQIQADGEGFVVQAKGMALQDGVKDGTIRVRNLASGRELQAVVLNERTVEIR